MAVDPSNASHVYTSTWRGLLFSSSDAGVSWSQISDSRTWANGQIYIAPSNPSVLYTTFDANDFGYTSVLTSTDGGNTWSEAGDPGGLPNGVSQLAIHPSDPNTEFVSTNLGVYKTANGTANGGATWSLAFAPVSGPLNAMGSIMINPSNPSQVYAGSDYFGFYRSLDSGSTWTLSNSGIVGASITGVQSSIPLTMYAAVQTVGILKSSDGGSTWNPIGANGTLQNLALGGLGVDPLDPNGNIFVMSAGSASTTNIYRSADGGSTLTAVDTGHSSPWYRFNPRK